jgi:hypothetical protein
MTRPQSKRLASDSQPQVTPARRCQRGRIPWRESHPTNSGRSLADAVAQLIIQARLVQADPYLDRLRAQHQPWADDWLRELYEWDALEDEPERSRLARGLESDDDGVFMSAAFELFLSGSFRQRGWRLERHPAIRGTGRLPDYLVHAGSEDFYVEAVLALESNARVAQHRVRRAL